MRPSPISVCLALAASSLMISASAYSQTPAVSPTGHIGMLGGARVSTLESGRIVVSMEATGDLPGLMTLTLDPDGGSGYTGQWALEVAYVENLNPDGSVSTARPEPEHLHEPVLHEQHREYIRAVRRGTLNGGVIAATLRRDANGQLTGIDFAQLTVGRGNLDFTGATGTGFMTTVVADGAVAGNSLTLTF
jgi:hypothetical protein